MTYHFELSDPEYLAAPVIGEVVWGFRPEQEFITEECDLTNARRFLNN